MNKILIIGGAAGLSATVAAVDERMRVVDEAGIPIADLYAAGIDISGVDSGDHSVSLSGHAFGFSLTGGRIAAQEMLRASSLNYYLHDYSIFRA